MKLIRENEVFLKAATVAHPQQGKALIESAKTSQLDSICEVLLNIVHGIIPLPEELFKKAVRYRRALREIVSKVLRKTLRKDLLLKYYNIVKQLLNVALPIIGLVVTGLQVAQN